HCSLDFRSVVDGEGQNPPRLFRRGGSSRDHAVPELCCGGAPPWSPPGPPVSTLATLKSLSTYTVTGVPSAFVMCASYAALPSASVSTRMIVPPETLACAAAVTFASVSPVRSV